MSKDFILNKLKKVRGCDQSAHFFLVDRESAEPPSPRVVRPTRCYLNETLVRVFRSQRRSTRGRRIFYHAGPSAVINLIKLRSNFAVIRCCWGEWLTLPTPDSACARYECCDDNMSLSRDMLTTWLSFFHSLVRNLNASHRSGRDHPHFGRSWCAFKPLPSIIVRLKRHSFRTMPCVG